MILNEAVTGYFGSDGIATAVLAPRGTIQQWSIKRIATTTESTAQTELRIYRNHVSPSTFIDGSKRANEDVNELTNQLFLTNMDRLVFIWTKGTPGSAARAMITGDIL